MRRKIVRNLAGIASAALFAVPGLRAVYAPIPEVEKGKALTVYASAGVYYDTNIFGGATNRVSSYVYQFSPSLAFNASLEAKTFVSASYALTYDFMPDRPGKKGLDSHAFAARVAHTFTPQMELDLSDSYQISKNPASLLPGLATIINTDQSYRRNQFDARYAASLTKRTGLIFKGRDSRYNYDDDNLGRSLDREEILGGLTLSHTLLPELQALLEYRHQVIDYSTGGDFKNKRSDYGMVGLDYSLSEKFSLSSRVGFEHRRREGEKTDTLPYVEFGIKADYAQGSYLAFGYGYSVEETSNIELYSDTSVNRFFFNLQQALGPQLAATASFTWEPSRLHGRIGVRADQSETNTQTGLALVYRPAKRWSVSATWDYDHVSSDDASRSLVRSRTGASVRYVF